jgi:hypothetical protein
MRRVIPTLDKLVAGIGPVIAVGDHRNLTSGGALHLFGKFELAAIGQIEPGAKMSVHQRRALSYRFKAGYNRIGYEALLYRVQVCLNGHPAASPVSRRSRFSRFSAIFTSEAHST